MRADHRKFVLWGGPLELVLVVLGILAWVCFPHRYIHRYPPEVRTAMRVAVGAWSLGGGPEQSVKRYLEAQFGSLTFATNREKAFLSFLNPNQITAYHLLMKHAPANENKANAAAAARWVAEYPPEPVACGKVCPARQTHFACRPGNGPAGHDPI